MTKLIGNSPGAYMWDRRKKLLPIEQAILYKRVWEPDHVSNIGFTIKLGKLKPLTKASDQIREEYILRCFEDKRYRKHFDTDYDPQ